MEATARFMIVILAALTVLGLVTARAMGGESPFAAPPFVSVEAEEAGRTGSPPPARRGRRRMPARRRDPRARSRSAATVHHSPPPPGFSRRVGPNRTPARRPPVRRPGGLEGSLITGRTGPEL